jgi:pSer/pThr/pTyr-binding forkhead associated (FHA) protein/S1-C subfamily serine protease
MNDDAHETQAAREVRRQLVDLVSRHGPGILDDSRRVRAMLADAVQGATAETNLIGLALSSGVPDRLREAGNDPARAGAAIEATAVDLERTSSVQAADARWAVAAIAEALGLGPAPGLRPGTTPAPSGGSGPAGPDDLVIRVAGREHVATAGSVVTVGREPGSTLLLDSSAVSRRHGRLHRGPSGWEYQDLGSTQGSFVGGVAVTAVTVTGELEVVLGQGPESVRLLLVPFGVAATRTPFAAAAPVAAGATVMPGRPSRPGGAFASVPAARTELGGSAADSVTVTLDGSSRTVAPGAVLTIGREDDNDLVTAAGTVSRHHARVEHREGRWYLQDLDTTSGTWSEGRRVSEVALSGRQELVLGDADRGARVVLETSDRGGTVPTAAGRATTRGGRLRLGPVAIAATAAGLALVLVGGFLGWQVLSDDETVPATAEAALSRDDLARATVYLETDTGAGSGVIIDSERGLILTNAHVAAPAAPGRSIATMRFKDQLDDNPTEIVVHVATGLDQSAEPRFTAEVVATDGYLDVAVLRIDSKLSGAPVEEQDLADLVAVPLGDSDQLRTSDDISFIGYPDASDSRAPTFTEGVVSSPVQDDRLDDFRAAINTTAAISFGNSGGLAVDDSGQMVGIPTWFRRNYLGEPIFSSIRPINLVKPVIDAAREGERYTSPWAVAGSPKAKKVGDFRLADPGQAGTVAAGCEAYTGDLSPLALGMRYSGLRKGPHTDVLAVLYRSGTPFAVAMAEFRTRLPQKGCMTLTFDREVPDGRYGLKVGIGGDLRVLYDGIVTLS